MTPSRGRRGTVFLLALAAAVWFVGFLFLSALAPESWGVLQLILLFVGILGMLPFIHLAQRKSQQAKDIKLGAFPCFFCGEPVDPDGTGHGVMELYVTNRYTSEIRNQKTSRYFLHPVCLGNAAHDSAELWSELGER
jgi:hypothetical protein